VESIKRGLRWFATRAALSCGDASGIKSGNKRGNSSGTISVSKGCFPFSNVLMDIAKLLMFRRLCVWGG
jgi:hypothetical protein